MRRGYADGPFGQVHYQDAANGKVPLVLIHQAPMSSRQFEATFAPFIGRGIRPIAIDIPGFGMSEPTTFVPTIEDWAKVVPAVLDHLNLEQVSIAGHHTGGLVATEVVRQFPTRVRKLVIAGPFPMSPQERQRYLDYVQEKEVDFEYEDDGGHLTKTFMIRRNLFTSSGLSPSAKLITRYTVEQFMGYGPFWYGHHAAFIYDHNASLLELKHPTLILTNTGDEIYGHAKATMQMRPDFSFVALNGGGVDIVDQQPEQWADAIVTFLNESPDRTFVNGDSPLVKPVHSQRAATLDAS